MIRATASTNQIAAGSSATSAAEIVPKQQCTATSTAQWLSFLGGHGLHPKLSVSNPGDPDEREADAIAERVMRMTAPAAAPLAVGRFGGAGDELARVCAGCEEDDERRIKRKARGPGIAPHAARAAADAVAAGGEPLGAAERAFFEPRFGHDLSAVRIHSDTAASRAAEGIDALAYTGGEHIAFAAGQYRPATAEGRRLLAHELAHTLQHSGGAPLLSGHAATPGTVNAAPEVSAQKPIRRAPATRLLREVIANKEFEMCHQVVKGDTWFDVDKGGLVIGAYAHWDDKEESDQPRAHDPDYGASSYRISVDDGTWWDSDRGGCTYPIGDSATNQWLNMPKGRYHLIISVGDHNPHFCLKGWVSIRQESGLTGASCTQAPRGPMEIIHDALSAAGMIPALGVIPDAINTGIYAIEGDWKGAGISAIAIIPYLGDGAQLVRMGEKFAVKVTDKGILKVGEQQLAKGLKEGKAAHAASEAQAAAKTRKAIEGATEVKLSKEQYEAALKTVFPSHYLSEASKLVDEIGQGAAHRAMNNPRFVAAMEQGNMTLAGSFFHTAAKEEARAVATAGRLPPGWALEAEKTMKAGKGGSRLDIFMTGPAGEIVEFDWKTTGKSALSSGSVKEMAKHAGEVRVKVGGQLTTQQSRSWMDYVRPLLP